MEFRADMGMSDIPQPEHNFRTYTRTSHNKESPKPVLFCVVRDAAEGSWFRCSGFRGDVGFRGSCSMALGFGEVVALGMTGLSLQLQLSFRACLAFP